MKKQYLVPICLFAILAFTVGGFLLIRRPLQSEVWITVPNGCSFVITNDHGETLVNERGTTNGTMKVLDYHAGPATSSYKVSNSDYFSFQSESEADDISFSVEWGNVFNFFSADRFQKVTISRNSVLVEGHAVNYNISAFTEADSSQRYELTGDEATWVRLERSKGAATAESSSAYAFELRDLYTGEVFGAHDSPDGAAFTLHYSEN